MVDSWAEVGVCPNKNTRFAIVQRQVFYESVSRNSIEVEFYHGAYWRPRQTLEFYVVTLIM